MSLVFLGNAKRCSKCRQYKPLAEFYKNTRNPHGVASRCKDCYRTRKYRSYEDRFWKLFWARTERVGSCLEWRGKYAGHGHGIPVCRHKEKRSASVRRVAYRLSRGDVSDDMFVLMTCSNFRCVSLYHMRLGTKEDAEVKRANSMPTGDRHGARLHPERLARGERANKSDLTESDICAAREEYTRGDISQRALAARLGITQRAVWQIVNYRTWKHVDAD